jgi:sulfite exporter TauE/SafE
LLDQFQTVYEHSRYYLPGITFLIGVMGSVHCSTMCGAFVLTCSGTKMQNASYQLGRLLSYAFLTLIIFTFSSVIDFEIFSKDLAVLASIILGTAFIYLGIQGLVGVKLKVKFPENIQKKINTIWKYFIARKKKNVRVSFAIGSLSVLLPCGLLYSLIIPLAAIDSLLWAILAIFTFWIGTLPVMGLAPVLIKNLLIPIRQKAPIFLSCFFISFGILMISVRIQSVYFSPAAKTVLEICH